MQQITIAHITDLHIQGDLQPVRGVNTAENFLKVLQDIQKNSVDIICLTGDLCYDVPERNAMQWIKKQLDRIKIPYEVIPGNHDESKLLAEVFQLNEELNGDEVYFKRVYDNKIFLFLDTAKGSISTHQKAWLQEQLASESSLPYLLFMHHPPVDAVPYMDANHSLKNKEELLEIIQKSNQVKGIFCGHYHIDKEIKTTNLFVYITPSSFFQIDDSKKEFAISSYEISWRKIIWNGNELDTELQYI